MSEKFKVARDKNGNVPPSRFFGVNYGAEIDAYLVPLSDEEYRVMAEDGRKLAHETLDASGYLNEDAHVVGYRVEFLRDKIHELGKNTFLGLGKGKYEKADQMLSEIIANLKTVQRSDEIPREDVREKVFGVLKKFKLKRFSEEYPWMDV